MGRGNVRKAALRPSFPRLRPALIVAGVLSVIGGCYGDSAPATPAQPVVKRGLHYLQQEAFRWKETRQCAACHHAATMIWTFNEARARGYSVDEQALQEITDWAFDMKKNSLTEQAPPRNVLNLGWVYLLLSVETAGSIERSTNRSIAADRVFKEDESIRSARETLIQQIVAKQTPDGSWGRPLDLRVPLGGPVEDIAILARTALLQVREPSAAVADCIRKAGDWLSANHEHTSPQGRNLRLLMDLIERKPAATLTHTLAAIEREQKSDGGWSQTPEVESDAYATGQTLYVLARAGVNPEAACMERGVAFLTRTQQSDGAWSMTSRVNAKNLTPIKGAGTAWAVLGLLRASPGDSHDPDKEF